MTVQHLIELSILDAMGLLDEDERLQFESAFRAATPGIQAHVRREQTRLSRIESLLPQVDPPPGLRALVLEAVRAHMVAEIPDEGISHLVLPMARSRNVSPFWRAGALGLAAASLMLGITTFLFQAQAQRIAQEANNGALFTAMAENIGPKFMDMLFDRDTEHVILEAQEGFRGEAAIFMNPEWERARFFCHKISTTSGRTYRLAIIDDGGQVVQVLDEFTANGELKSIEVPIKPGATGRVAIVSSVDGRDPVVRMSAPLPKAS